MINTIKLALDNERPFEETRVDRHARHDGLQVTNTYKPTDGNTYKPTDGSNTI